MRLTLNERQKVILIIVVTAVLLLLLVFAVIYSVRRIGSQADVGNPDTTVTQDNASGESFVKQKGVLPEQEQNSSKAPVYAGFGMLVNYGVTTDQVTALQHALAKYQPFAQSQAQISLAVDDIRKVGPDNQDPLYRWSIASHIVVNQKTSYQIKFYYWETSKIRLYIYDATGKTQLFDSGTVTN